MAAAVGEIVQRGDPSVERQVPAAKGRCVPQGLPDKFVQRPRGLEISRGKRDQAVQAGMRAT